MWRAIVRFVALDMRGGGGHWRPAVVLAEVAVTGAIGCSIGWLVLDAADSPQAYVLGAWLAGIGLNYVPLAAAATTLYRNGRLGRELADARLANEQRRAALSSIWLAIPGGVLIIAMTDPRAATGGRDA